MVNTYTQLRARRDTTVSAMLDGIMRVPSYAVWGRSHRDKLTTDLHTAMSIIIDGAGTSEPITADGLGFFRDLGRQRGVQRFPLIDLRAGFRLSYLAGLRELFSLAGTDNHTELTNFTDYATREHPRMLAAAELAFLSAYRALGDANIGRLRLLEYLLDGRDGVDALALEVNIQLFPAYTVQVFRLPCLAEPGAIQRGDRLHQCFGEFPTVLWRCDSKTSEVHCLVPAEQSTAKTAVAKQLAESLAKALGRKLVSTQALATAVSAIPHAYQEAKQALAVATAMPDVRTEPYRVEELLVELAVAQQPDLRQRLEDLLAPLTAGTELRATLQELFAHELDRGSTARSLFIHRRTLTYRIQRIHELTGIDPATPHGIQLLRTALTATRLT